MDASSVEHVHTTARFAHYTGEEVAKKVAQFKGVLDVVSQLTLWLSHYLCDPSTGKPVSLYSGTFVCIGSADARCTYILIDCHE